MSVLTTTVIGGPFSQKSHGRVPPPLPRGGMVSGQVLDRSIVFGGAHERIDFRLSLVLPLCYPPIFGVSLRAGIMLRVTLTDCGPWSIDCLHIVRFLRIRLVPSERLLLRRGRQIAMNPTQTTSCDWVRKGRNGTERDVELSVRFHL